MANQALVVDDSASVREVVAFTLKDAGFEITEAADGQQALDVASQKSFSLVFTDLNMPVMDGMTLIRNLRQLPAFKRTPILMLTTEAQKSKIQEGRAAGATGWIVKPFEPRQILDVVNKVVF